MFSALTVQAKTDVATTDDFTAPPPATAGSGIWTVSSANGEPECIYHSPTNKKTVVVGPEWMKQLCPAARSYPTPETKPASKTIETAFCIDGGLLDGPSGAAAIPLFICLGNNWNYTNKSHCIADCTRLYRRG